MMVLWELANDFASASSPPFWPSHTAHYAGKIEENLISREKERFYIPDKHLDLGRALSTWATES